MAFHIEHKPTKYVRGWPTPSLKPWSVYRDGVFAASFKAKRDAEMWVGSRER